MKTLNFNGDEAADVPYSATNGHASGVYKQEEDTYGFEAKVNYAFDAGDGISGHLWASYITQEVDWKNDVVVCDGNIIGGTCDAENIQSSESDADVDGFDIGGKLVMGDFDIVAYYYDGEGIGTTDFLMDGIDAAGDERDSDGYYVQGRWRTPMGTLLGISYGESELDMTDFDEMRYDMNTPQDNAGVATGPSTYSLVESNDLFVIGAYHPIGEGLNLVLEYSRVESEAHNGNESEEDSVAVGAIMFF